MLDTGKISNAAKAVDWKPADLKIYHRFKQQFHNWIASSKQPVKGLPDTFYIVTGITDAFNQTYGLFKNIGVFPGEYGYHRLAIGNRCTTDLAMADVIIISHPFSADGMSAHDKLAKADLYGKPIFVDCAFFGSCRNINFDFSKYKNIQSVCFSLSKTFGTGHHRVGLLYTAAAYPAAVYEQWHYPVVSSAQHHYGLLDTMSPDDLAVKYGRVQLEICEELGIVPSDTVIFGLDYSDKFAQFNRGGVNRLCISDLIRDRYHG